MTPERLIDEVRCNKKGVMLKHHINGRLGPVMKAEKSIALPHIVQLTIENPYRWMTAIDPIAWEFAKMKKAK